MASPFTFDGHIWAHKLPHTAASPLFYVYKRCTSPDAAFPLPRVKLVIAASSSVSAMPFRRRYHTETFSISALSLLMTTGRRHFIIIIIFYLLRRYAIHHASSSRRFTSKKPHISSTQFERYRLLIFTLLSHIRASAKRRFPRAARLRYSLTIR